MMFFQKKAKISTSSSVDPSSLTRKNFHWTEFFVSEVAARLGIDNSLEANFPQDAERKEIIWNGHFLADQTQKIRDYVAVPLTISSGYRCPALNKAVGGSPTSQHMKLEAVDLKSDKISLDELFNIIRKMHKLKLISVNQCFIERGCVHYASYREAAKNKAVFGTWKP